MAEGAGRDGPHTGLNEGARRVVKAGALYLLEPWGATTDTVS